MIEVIHSITRIVSSTIPIVDRATSYTVIHIGAVFHYHPVLTLFSHHPDTQVRIFLTGKRTHDSKVYLYYLAVDTNEDVRLSLARSKQKLPGEILATLATDESEKVKCAVASRREELPIPIYYPLLRNDSTKVQIALALNVYSPQWVLSELAKNGSPGVLEALKSNSSLSDETRTFLFLKKK